MTIIVLDTEHATYFESRADKEYIWKYHLPADIKLREPHSVRLILTTPKPATNLFILADFLPLQVVDKKYLPYLGSTVSYAVNPWIPLDRDTIPADGRIRIIAPEGKVPKAPSRLTIALQLTPTSSLHGTQGSA